MNTAEGLLLNAERNKSSLEEKQSADYNIDMLEIEHGRNVVMLRPVGISPSNKIVIANEEKDFDAHLHQYLKNMDQIVGTTRTLLKKIADKESITLNLYDYDLPDETGVPSYTATKWIKHTNLMTTFDPTNTQLAYIIACMRENPVMSVLVSCTDNEYLEDRMDIMMTQVTAIMGRNEIRKQQRIFPTHVRKKHESKNAPTIREALLFPYEAI